MNGSRALPRTQFFVLTALLMLAFSNAADAKTTTDPNHNGWSGKGSRLTSVDWKPVASKCLNCQKIVGQYNATMTSLLRTRADIQFAVSGYENSRKSVKDSLQYSNLPIDQRNLVIVEKLEALQTAHESRVNALRKYQLQLEEQAKHLQWAISECEKTCAKGDRTKLKEIEVGGAKVKEIFQPALPALFKTYGATWTQPQQTSCPPCQSIVTTLNQVPGWLTRAHFALLDAESKLKIDKLDSDYDAARGQPEPGASVAQERLRAVVETRKSEIKALVKIYEDGLKALAACIEKFCPVKKVGMAPDALPGNAMIAVAGPPQTCPATAATEPLIVGANNDVGSSADFKDKIKKKALGTVGGIVGGLIGGGGGGGGQSSGPVTYKNPVRKKQKTKIVDRAAKRELVAGAVFTPEGLMVSSEIDKAPGKGTFQAIYLENDRGWRIQPIGFYLFEIWQGWKLTVSWTKDTYVNGEHVKHEEGGWSESWKELIASGEEVIYGEVYDAPVWEQMGFNTAVSGVRGLGTLFPISPAMLRNEPITLVIHVTDPKKDPVITYPYVLRLSLDNQGVVVVEELDQSPAMANDACTDPTYGAPTETLTAGDDTSAIVDEAADEIVDLADDALYTTVGDIEGGDDPSIIEIDDTPKTSEEPESEFEFDIFYGLKGALNKQFLFLHFVRELLDEASPNPMAAADDFGKMAEKFVKDMTDEERESFTRNAQTWLANTDETTRTAFERFRRWKEAGDKARAPAEFDPVADRKFRLINRKLKLADEHLANSFKVEMENEARTLRTQSEKLRQEGSDESLKKAEELEAQAEDLERKANNIQKTSDAIRADAEKLIDELNEQERREYDRRLKSNKSPTDVEYVEAEPFVDPGPDLTVSAETPSLSEALQSELEGVEYDTTEAPAEDATPERVKKLTRQQWFENQNKRMAAASQAEKFEHILDKFDAADAQLSGPFNVEITNEAEALRTQREELAKDGSPASSEEIKEIDERIKDLDRKAANVRKSYRAIRNDAFDLLDALTPADAVAFEEYKKDKGISEERPEESYKTLPANDPRFNTLEEEVEKQRIADELAKKKDEDDGVAYCGPDVTAGFLESLDLVHHRLKLLGDTSQGFVDGTLFMYNNGQIIDYKPQYLDWTGTAGNCPSGHCGSSDPCYQLFDGCVPAHVLSDTMYAFVASFLDVSLTVTKAGGAHAEFNEPTLEQRRANPGDWLFLKATMNSFFEDAVNETIITDLRSYKAPIVEKEASIEAYRFGHRLGQAVKNDNVDLLTLDPDDLEEHSLSEYAPSRYANAFAEMLEMGTYYTWPMMDKCANCPDRTPLRTIEFKDGMFVEANNFSRKDWKVVRYFDDGPVKERFQTLNEAFLFYDPSETTYEESKEHLDVTFTDDTGRVRSWTKFYTENGITRPLY